MLVKVVFLFPTNMKLPFCQKSKDDLFPKNAPKDDISGITEKYDIYPRKDDTPFLFYKNSFYKNHETENRSKIKNFVRITAGSRSRGL